MILIGQQLSTCIRNDHTTYHNWISVTSGYLSAKNVIAKMALVIQRLNKALQHTLQCALHVDQIKCYGLQHECISIILFLERKLGTKTVMTQIPLQQVLDMQYACVNHFTSISKCGSKAGKNCLNKIRTQKKVGIYCI